MRGFTPLVSLLLVHAPLGIPWKSASIIPMSLSVALFVVSDSVLFSLHNWVLPTFLPSWFLFFWSYPFTYLPKYLPVWLIILSSSSVVTYLSWYSKLLCSACVISYPLYSSSLFSVITFSLVLTLAGLFFPWLSTPSSMAFNGHLYLYTPDLYFLLSSPCTVESIYCSSTSPPRLVCAPLGMPWKYWQVWAPWDFMLLV